MDASVIGKMELMCPGQSLPWTISFLTNDFSSRQRGSSRKSGRFPWRFEDLFHKAHWTFPSLPIWPPLQCTFLAYAFYWLGRHEWNLGIMWWHKIFFVLQETLWQPWLPAQPYYLRRWYPEIGGKFVTQAVLIWWCSGFIPMIIFRTLCE